MPEFDFPVNTIWQELYCFDLLSERSEDLPIILKYNRYAQVNSFRWISSLTIRMVYLVELTATIIIILKFIITVAKMVEILQIQNFYFLSQSRWFLPVLQIDLNQFNGHDCLFFAIFQGQKIESIFRAILNYFPN